MSLETAPVAELRLTPSLPAVTTPARASSNDAVRAAQRAFFEVALTASGTAAPTRPAAAPAAVQAAASTAATPPGGAEGRRSGSGPGSRPGALLDIRV